MCSPGYESPQEQCKKLADVVQVNTPTTDNDRPVLKVEIPPKCRRNSIGSHKSHNWWRRSG